MRNLAEEPPFGLLTALHPEGKTKAGQIKWRCRCQCGKETVVADYTLVSGNTKSCGCLRHSTSKRLHTKHGMSDTRTYRIWQIMMRRCYDKNLISYAEYGGSGITVAPEWHRFEKFFEDMDVCPDGLTLDREESTKNYSPDNCRWANRCTQAANRSITVFVEHEGQTRPLSEWARIVGIKRATLYKRLFIMSWPTEEALHTPTNNGGGRRRRCPQTQKEQAKHAIHVATRTGKLVRPLHCQIDGCIEADIQAHHHNGYSPEHYLDVMWLCSAHHPKPNEIVVTFGGQTKTLREWSMMTGVPRKRLYGRLKKSGWVATAATFAQKNGRGLEIQGHDPIG